MRDGKRVWATVGPTYAKCASFSYQDLRRDRIGMSIENTAEASIEDVRAGWIAGGWCVTACFAFGRSVC